MIGALLAVVGAYGVFLVYTGIAFGWRGLGTGPGGESKLQRRRGALRSWLVQAGLGDVRVAELAAVGATLFALAAAGAWTLFGGVVGPAAAGLGAATAPLASARARRERRLATAREAWPQMLEEIRVLVVSAGRSIPQALFEAGRGAPAELRPAFAAAEREWLLTTDFARTVAVLKDGLADATADAACETLLVAHEVGGTDVDRRLTALIEDRTMDLQGRKDAASKLAGVRFARRFVLAVPVGMALCGLAIGDGREAYRTGAGQAGVAVAAALILVLWVAAGRLMRLPDEERVFA